MDDAFKKAEQRGYAKGYAAGKRNVAQGKRSTDEHARKQALLDRAFIAALPFAMQQDAWKRGDKSITSVDDRVRLAWDVAESAAKNRRYA